MVFTSLGVGEIMSKLIRLLRRAHAIEIGAYEAYEGHWRSTKDPVKRKRIQEIQKDELDHKQMVGFMLIFLGAESNKDLDWLMYFVGRLVSISCYVIGSRAAAWGAKLFEVMGSDLYKDAAAECLGTQNEHMSETLWKMGMKEQEHEEFFKSCLKPNQEASKELVP